MEENLQKTSAMPPEQLEKKRFCGNMLFTTGGLLIYFAIVNFISITAVMLRTIFIMVTSSSQTEVQEKIAQIQSVDSFTMGVMIIATLVGIAFMFLFFMKREKLKQLFEKRGSITPAKLLMMASVIMGMQFVFSLASEGAEYLFNLVGLTLQKSIESSQANNTGVMEVIYIGFLAPILEEIVFRGFIMHGLNKFGGGKVFAIVVSSVLFGAFHQNPTQSVFTVFIGLVFAYAAMEYGLVWSIALHMINNLIFGEILSYLLKMLPDDKANMVSLIIQCVFFVIAIAFVVLKRKQLKTYVQENRTPARYYGWTFGSVTVIVFIVINALFALLMIGKL